MLKIATWNVNSLKVRLPQVLSYLEEEKADILALQELKLPPADFPQSAFQVLGYECVWSGQKTYNGVALISRLPPTDPVLDNPYFADEQKRVIAATIGGVRVINVYCVNGQAVGSDKYAYKEKWFKGLADYLRHELKKYSELIVLGDFNIAPADLDVYNPKAWTEKIMCSEEERSWFREILSLGVIDGLRHLDGTDPLYTWWDYRMNAFKRNLGLRIDHILLTPNLAEKSLSFAIGKNYRANPRPSDHAPVAITLDLAQSGQV